MRRRTRIALTIAVIVGMLGAGFLAYGWWTRRGPIAFEQGGAFGSPAADTPAGRYLFDASGEERVSLGGIRACGWPVDDIEMTVSDTSDATVIDQRIGERLERLIHRTEPDGIHLTYAASTVTCLGIRTTSEDTYEPPPLRFRLPLATGSSWTTTATSAHRTEDATVTVLRSERVTVPAGTFDTFVVELRARFTGEQEGSIEQRSWFAPALGIWVKQESETEADRSGARFSSSWTSELASMPEPTRSE